jgi:AraC-like DNA-binding protein
MKIMHPDMLYRYDYSIKAINSLRQFWRINKTFSCINRPKSQNIFVFLDGCSAVYTDASGSSVKAESGSLIYAPEGMEYSARFERFENESSSTVGINFRLFDEYNFPIVLENKITVYRSGAFRELVKKIDDADKGNTPCYAAMKSGIYDIISIIGSTQNTLDDRFKIIGKGIEYLEGGNFVMPMEKIAEGCNVSDSYFRKLFKEYAGISPMQYRMNTKLGKAKDYLLHTALNSSEIADLLLFNDTSFFCRYFKSRTGMTPEDFRKANK